MAKKTVENLRPMGEAREAINDNFTELYNAVENSSSEFTDLTDTPATLDAGSYLRVNSTGDGVEQIKTAPPDGGLGDNSIIQGESNFDGKLPDAVILDGSVGLVVYELTSVNPSEIRYTYWSAATNSNSYYVTFNNDPTGSNWTREGLATNHSASDSSTLQEFIDNGRAVFHGQKSGTSGIGKLNVIKSQVENFYTDLPDYIIATHKGGYETVLRLKFAKNITSQPDGRNFWYEARIDTTSTSTCKQPKSTCTSAHTS